MACCLARSKSPRSSWMRRRTRTRRGNGTHGCGPVAARSATRHARRRGGHRHRAVPWPGRCRHDLAGVRRARRGGVYRVPAISRLRCSRASVAVLTHFADFWPMVGLTAVTSPVSCGYVGKRSEVVLLAGAMIVGTSLGVAASSTLSSALARVWSTLAYRYPKATASPRATRSRRSCSSARSSSSWLSMQERCARACGRCALCSIAIVLVSISRVYLGVHWFGDITASWILGFGIMSLATALYFVVTAGDSELDSRTPSGALRSRRIAPVQASGITMVKVDPTPGFEETSTSPSDRSTTCRTSARPSPVPPLSREIARGRRGRSARRSSAGPRRGCRYRCR